MNESAISIPLQRPHNSLSLQALPRSQSYPLNLNYPQTQQTYLVHVPQISGPLPLPKPEYSPNIRVNSYFTRGHYSNILSPEPFFIDELPTAIGLNDLRSFHRSLRSLRQTLAAEQQSSQQHCLSLSSLFSNVSAIHSNIKAKRKCNIILQHRTNDLCILRDSIGRSLTVQNGPPSSHVNSSFYNDLSSLGTQLNNQKTSRRLSESSNTSLVLPPPSKPQTFQRNSLPLSINADSGLSHHVVITPTPPLQPSNKPDAESGRRATFHGTTHPFSSTPSFKPTLPPVPISSNSSAHSVVPSPTLGTMPLGDPSKKQQYSAEHVKNIMGVLGLFEDSSASDYSEFESDSSSIETDSETSSEYSAHASSPNTTPQFVVAVCGLPLMGLSRSKKLRKLARVVQFGPPARATFFSFLDTSNTHSSESTPLPLSTSGTRSLYPSVSMPAYPLSPAPFDAFVTTSVIPLLKQFGSVVQSASLGDLAHFLVILSYLLNTPLPNPLIPFSSHSFVFDTTTSSRYRHLNPLHSSLARIFTIQTSNSPQSTSKQNKRIRLPRLTPLTQLTAVWSVTQLENSVQRVTPIKLRSVTPEKQRIPPTTSSASIVQPGKQLFSRISSSLSLKKIHSQKENPQAPLSSSRPLPTSTRPISRVQPSSSPFNSAILIPQSTTFTTHNYTDSVIQSIRPLFSNKSPSRINWTLPALRSMGTNSDFLSFSHFYSLFSDEPCRHCRDSMIRTIHLLKTDCIFLIKRILSLFPPLSTTRHDRLVIDAPPRLDGIYTVSPMRYSRCNAIDLERLSLTDLVLCLSDVLCASTHHFEMKRSLLIK
ncbi:hypothetical protein BLNAU_8849 [Blattamonas nauphoetae]|uniref:Uncharacterized protein n=1 Tax=Blattamonas nauphoetae TaxID=2049346 RepID=A0ABQ9XXT3_9EUKA|nr:hypothetical protein BLNAU_8849 [Blattamonas nauphoetae]